MTVNTVPKSFKPVREYLLKQKRFKHLTAEAIQEIEQQRDAEWDQIKKHWLA